MSGLSTRSMSNSFLQQNLDQTKGPGTGKIILFAITRFRYIEVLFSFTEVKKIQE